MKKTGVNIVSDIPEMILADKKELKQNDSRTDNETCTICLDEFNVGCKYKVLPCSHAYHSEVWLRNFFQKFIHFLVY